MALSESEVINLIYQQMTKFDDVKLYYTCKELKIYRKSLNVVKVVLALNVLGLPITERLVTLIIGTRQNHSALHNLGDKNVLVWKRKHGILEWIVSPWFIEKIL